jgi:nicotinamidase-related amidase
VEWDVAETAIVICDMWDNHWCRGSADRVNALAARMAPVVAESRRAGIQIIHAPSDTLKFYEKYPQRSAMASMAKVAPPPARELAAPPLPFDPNGACETGDKFFLAWTRENPAISIGANDVISDSGVEIYSFLKKRNIRNLLFMGVHANGCVLDRSFGIKQMTAWGLRCVLVRDLTDAGSNPKEEPFVSRDKATEMVVEYIESNWCPSISSGELLAAFNPSRRSSASKGR